MTESTMSLAGELTALGYAALTGAVMGIYYDVFRIIRRVFRCGYVTVVSQDIFFWLTSAVGVFFAAIISSGGIVRINFVLVALAVAFVYCMTVGAAVVFAASTVIRLIMNTVLRVFDIIFSKIILPAWNAIAKIPKRFKKIEKKGE